MAKALFGHVVAPAELRVVEENALLRAKVRRLEQEVERLRTQRDAAIAHDLLSLARRTPSRLSPDGTARTFPSHPHHRPRYPGSRPFSRLGSSSVHLSSLTLKGFKSFASATTLRLEPGITAVVGPNGSGKSNVVDAIAWVLGEQGAKSLRGGKMEDVIFAGTAGRPALGRAEVTLTIDNTDGALPIAYAEVSITRRMYRSGESEYEINGDKVRLLDVQELLSDSGIGREMHVIVGQGQLDAVLSGRPEDRRAFIEEAAGVLKHRKRKEKALRKLDGMQHNLDRLADLTAELRRQLKPLGRQAEVARRAAGVQSDLRDARLRLLADDLVQLRDALDRDVADETAARRRRTEVEAALAVAAQRESALESSLAASAPLLATASDTWYRLSALTERFRGIAQLAAERHRHLSAAAPVAAAGRDPDQLDAEADRVEATEAELAAGLAAERERLGSTVALRGELEGALAEAERAWVAAARALADRREGLARLSGEVAAARSRVTAGQAEIERLTLAAGEATDRAEVAADRLADRREQVVEQEDSDVALVTAHEDAVAAHAAAARRVTELTEAERAAERDRASWQARRDALAQGLTPADGAAAVLEAGLDGVLGPLAERLTVRAGERGRGRRRAGRDGRCARRLRCRPRPRRRWDTSRSPAAGPGCWSPVACRPCPATAGRCFPTAPSGPSTSSMLPPNCTRRWPAPWTGSPWCPRSTTR